MRLPSSVQARWQSVSRREQRLVLVALAVVAAALLWWVTLAPALNTLKAAEKQGLVLDAQLQQMLRMQAQAQTLKAQPKLMMEDSRRILEASLKELGAGAELSGAGERVMVSLKGAPADALAQWLSSARQNAHAVPTEAHLVRNPNGAWDGTVVLLLSTR